MKTAREAYLKLREVKYHHLVNLYKQYLKKIPSNCRYNYAYKFSSDNNQAEIKLCLLHQPNLDLNAGVFPHLVDVCQEPKHCISCNAFILRHTKDSVKDCFEKELQNIKIKASKYPDICALEWVLEQASDTVPLNWFKKIKIYIFNLFKINRI